MANNTDSPSTDTGTSPVLFSHVKNEGHQALSASSVGDSRILDSVSSAVIQRMREKDREWRAIKSKEAPLTLMDLPVDVLRLIVSQIGYPNDLIALALTHSALYKLAVPKMYARFDIVWPSDTTVSSQNSKSVDALSYGLSTLCLPSKFAEKAKWLSKSGSGQRNVSRQLTNNDYARYVRNFSIGNGPADWTSEYLITKESGKMLGTLIAIAVSKMVNLESFVWDMPTGVLSDIFMALSSLGDEQGQAKLEKVWIRWHDNRSATPALSSTSSPPEAHPPTPTPLQIIQTLPPDAPSTLVGHYLPSDTDIPTSYLESYADSSVEYPTFSVLPPLKSLTVLYIDELSYLDEMSVLIERSASHLRELQVGISARVQNQDFVQPWDGVGLQQVDHDAKWPGETRIPITRLGGVLGVLVGRIHDIRGNPNAKSEEVVTEWEADGLGDAETAELRNGTNKISRPPSTKNNNGSPESSGRKRLDGKLKLQKLSLQRVPLSVAVCLRAIDWNNLTTITILKCKHHEGLWKALRRQFQPTRPANVSFKPASTRYHLALKHLHTDQASLGLINFLQETIAPNTLETLYLQDRQRTAKPAVTLEQVFKSTVKRQWRSLRKLLIDSSDRDSSTPSGRWTHWAVKGQFLSYITSGRMKKLKELGMAIGVEDWHTFLQRLPQLESLCALYIPNMLGNYEGRSLPPPKEFALNIVDAISLRREIRLVYIGLWHKCFEITEVAYNDSSNNTSQDVGHAMSVDEAPDNATDDMEDNNVLTDVDDESMDEMPDDVASEPDSFVEDEENKPRLGLREILYCDDRVGLFQARHGKL
ncbi:hypothetical protein GGR50DRAFT_670924 [Xylaria sp. CBS 124048]|nr:hypothetical protein GGR50DRAFT_670924 [Xylaria sp. CBS 124048]